MKNTIKVQWLSFLLSLILLTGLMPAAVSVAETDHEYTAATEQEFFNAVEKINQAEIDHAIVTLTQNFTITRNAEITAGTLTLLGAGHTLTFNGGSLCSGGNAVLNLGRENSSDRLDITSIDPIRTVIMLTGTAILNMYNGTVIRDSEARAQAGGVQAVDASKFNMYGGEIKNCCNLYSVSGGVLVDDSSIFTMYGGTISNCRGMQGGAVCLGGGSVIGGSYEENSSFFMYGGTILDCTDGYLGGGAVCVYTPDKVNLYIDGGTITGCAGTGSGYGGAVFIYTTNQDSSVRIERGTFTKNTAKYGGFLFMYRGNAVLGEKAAVYDNAASDAGDDIYSNGNGASVTLENLPAGLKLEDCGHTVDGWYADGMFENNETLRWSVKPCGSTEEYRQQYLPDGNAVTGETALKAAHGELPIDYTVEFYYDGVIDPSVTVHASAKAGTVISYENSYKNDETVNKQGYVPAAPSESMMVTKGRENVLKIYFVTEQIYDYTIHYYIDGIKDRTLEEKGVSTEAEIKNIPDKCPGEYVLDRIEHGTVTEPESGKHGAFSVHVYYTHTPVEEGEDKPLGDEGTAVRWIAMLLAGGAAAAVYSRKKKIYSR